MSEARQDIAGILVQYAFTEWLTTLGLVFGGCCSNAWALELATSQNPHAGTLITFAQFLLVSLYGLCKHLTLTPIEDYRLVASNIRRIRSEQRKRVLWVAIEGHPTNASQFATALSDELRRRNIGCEISSYGSTYSRKDLPLLESISGKPTPEDSIVLVHGPDILELRSRWDYFIFLNKDTHPPPLMDPSLRIDITHPSPSAFPWNLLTSLPRIRLAKRSIPISRWAVQVLLFLLTSLLNNAAFGYNVPMAVHIIFRSGGLVVNMVMGWLVDGRRYNVTQIISVIVVTLGVICTTLSASQPSGGFVTSESPGSYFVGISILTLALVVSGFMGLAQDKAYAQYGRGHWQEAMFYLHFLALPGFAFMWRDIRSQVRTVNASARTDMFFVPLASVKSLPILNILQWRFRVPSFYFPLVLNVGTQLLCVSGVHRLTSRVNSLTVTLVLVVRKAVSLGISVVVLEKGRGGGAWLWAGAGLVLVGTVGYAAGGKRHRKAD